MANDRGERRQRIALLAATAAIGGIVAAGVAAAADRSRTLLAATAAALPGDYRLDSGADGAAVALTIVEVYAPALGERVFYLHEAMASDPSRIVQQRLLALNPLKRRDQVLVTLFALREPLRWRQGHRQPELFKSLVRDDLRGLGACDRLLLRREAAPGAATAELVARFVEPSCGSGLRLGAAGLYLGDAGPFRRSGVW
ncbi:MAG: CpcT/CpeT family chromophore lyase [Steroidobacteraceae bacterium]|nr:CpcT/CpeT family chromophore lyase [Steroidobacteraceae bacterium]MDW8260255.1 CpcT/CpeT family chromophore lyase [Gammaproteobacteria bacterium]